MTNINKKQPTLSIIVTSHEEGLVAHKTMLSIERATEELKKNDISYEIIVSIDNGGSSTKKYFSKYTQKHPSTRTLFFEYGDLSSSRNAAAKEARGQYLAFIDADDLMSKNWLLKGYTIAKETGAIIHPEYSITFEADNLIWKKEGSTNTDLDTIRLIDNNLWDSPCIAKKSIFHKFPYVKNGDGFGYEDKHFNSQTIASNIKHLVAPETIIFVRRKLTGSMLIGAMSTQATLAPSELFSFDRISNIDINKHARINDPPKKNVLRSGVILYSKKIARKIHNRSKGNAAYSKAIEPLRELYHNKIDEGLQQQYPKWMTDEWKEIHKIENKTFPSKDLLRSLPWYNSNNEVVGERYVTLVRTLSKKPDTIFFVPHLIKGGADKLFINYTNELIRTKPNWNITMLQTEDKESVWKDKLHDTVDFIDFLEIVRGLDDSSTNRLLAMLIVQNNIKRIIIGNSQLAYDFVEKYKTLVQRLDIAVYCYAFGEEFDEEGRLWGHIHTGIPRIYESVHAIITDNQTTVDKLCSEYSFDKSKFKVHYQPTELKIEEEKKEQPNKKVRILWASRVCKQKRPDILKKVSNKLDINRFEIDAWGQLEEGLTEQYFLDSKVKYKGPFNGVDSLPTQDYDIYLYTSEGDGIPNVLQEMTASGLPIVASNVGGIGEFVKNNETGFLIEDHEAIEDYVTSIEKLSDPPTRRRLITNAQNLLKTQFSKDSWKKSLEKDFNK